MARLAALAAAVAVLALPGLARASQGMLVGAAEDAAEAPSLAQAKAKMDLAKLAGLDAIRLTAQWRTGETAPSPALLTSLQNAVGAADLDGITVFLSVYPSGSSVTPRTPRARADFAAFASSICALSSALGTSSAMGKFPVSPITVPLASMPHDAVFVTPAIQASLSAVCVSSRASASSSARRCSEVWRCR